MGLLFSRFRSKPSTKELLEDVEKEIEALEEYKQSTELQQKVLVRSLVFYSVLFYIIIASIVLFYSYPVTTKDRLIYSIPFLVFPFLLYVLKKFLQWYFLQKLRNNDENLLELRKRKKSLLDFAMETETYKVVKELLEKYDPAYHKRVFEARPAIEASPSATPLKGSFSDMELRRRSVAARTTPPNSGPSPGPTITINSSAVRPPMQPMPRPILPRERTLIDRLVDYLVGDGPSNRYALICRQCQSHNGMAIKEEFEFVGFRCCYCFQFNPPRNQHPPPPRLTLPAPPVNSSTPAITAPPLSEGSRSSEGSSSEETEIENVSDISSMVVGNSTELKEDVVEIKDSSLHRLSVSSDSEIQANLVEDQPYISDLNKSDAQVHQNSDECS